jgi:iron complex transport system ATP-binding protein
VREAVLQTERLSIGYQQRRGQSRVVAADIEVTLGRGELVCLLGPNGAGKSTFLRTVSGLQAPVSGRVTLDGRDVHALSTLERARGMSVVLTDRIGGGLFTSYDIVSLGRQPHTDWRGRLTSRDHEIVRRSLDAVGALDLAARPVAELSDGERQRVMVGRALAQEPRVMILDEITAFLDLPRRVEIMQLLKDLAHHQGTSVLVSTHDLDLALRTADQFWLVAGNGRIECGSPEDLVLAGTIEQTFSSARAAFDPRDGTFRMRREAAGVVALHGQGATARWTAHAIERAGFEVADDTADAVFQVFIPTHATESWRLHGPLGEAALSSLHDLVTALRREGVRGDGVASRPTAEGSARH